MKFSKSLKNSTKNEYFVLNERLSTFFNVVIFVKTILKIICKNCCISSLIYYIFKSTSLCFLFTVSSPTFLSNS